MSDIRPITGSAGFIPMEVSLPRGKTLFDVSGPPDFPTIEK
jgi:hypothetical protein